jgi:hypothetical protein
MIPNSFDNYVEKAVLDKIRMTVRTQVPKEVLLQNITVEALVDKITGDMVYTLHGYLYGKNYHKTVTTIKYPANWFESLKDAFIPKWLPSLFPYDLGKYFKPKYIEKDVTITETYVCPHINKASDQEHVEFLIYRGNGWEPQTEKTNINPMKYYGKTNTIPMKYYV